MDDSRLVYSTDPKLNQRCSRCRKLVSECLCSGRSHLPKKSDRTAVLRIEKSGRKGKTVSVVDRLPRSGAYLENLAKKLKTRCGSGGTYYIQPMGGVIEVQGDKRDLIRKILGEEGIGVKG